MNEADEALLILLAVVLSILVLLLIAATIYVLKILKIAKRIARDAEKLMDSAEVVGEALKSANGPMAVVGVVRSLSRIVKQKKRGKK